ncbi:MAG: hypothetical protein BZY83_07590 [SAR202 cluster bacterium Casp-Chloro-G2]|nr:MAG: hypothetical protein BZY83_07590 [SAR202 cluster bacterium Casp-Chloro-G2]
MCQDAIFTEREGQYPNKIAELDVCTAVLNRDWQFFRGSTILVFRDHVKELHHLTSELQRRFMDDAARVATALEKTFPGLKLNHALLGNATPHLHWHLIVRHSTDPHPRLSIWEFEFPKTGQSDEELIGTADQIRRNL